MIKFTLDSFFDKIFVITCKSFVDRQQYIVKHFEDKQIKNFSFIYATDKNNFKDEIIPKSAKSLIDANIKCIEKSIELNYNKILICEDDVNFITDFDVKFDMFIKNLPDDWDFLHLGNQFWTDIYKPEWLRIKKENDYVNRFFWGTGSHCIGLNNKSFIQCINYFKKMEHPLDILYYNLYSNKKAYSPVQFIADALSSQSDHGYINKNQIFQSEIIHGYIN